MGFQKRQERAMPFNPNQPIVERHARRLMGLEDTQARIIMREYTRALRELKSRLLSVQDNTFTEARLKTTIAQLEIFLIAIKKKIDGHIFDSSSFSFEQGVEDSVSEILRFEKEYTGVTLAIDLDSILNSVEKRNYLINNFQTSIDAYSGDLRKRIQGDLTQSLIQGKTYSQSVDSLSNMLQNSLWKAHRIVRTEMHQIYNISKMDGMGQIKEKYIPDLKKMLVHPMDDRTAKDSKQLKEINPVVPIDKPFKFKYQGETRTFMAPPDRPNDRAILIPVREKYLENDK